MRRVLGSVLRDLTAKREEDRVVVDAKGRANSSREPSLAALARLSDPNRWADRAS
jgi:hypothetical protein